MTKPRRKPSEQHIKLPGNVTGEPHGTVKNRKKRQKQRTNEHLWMRLHVPRLLLLRAGSVLQGQGGSTLPTHHLRKTEAVQGWLRTLRQLSERWKQGLQLLLRMPRWEMPSALPTDDFGASEAVQRRLRTLRQLPKERQ